MQMPGSQVQLQTEEEEEVQGQPLEEKEELQRQEEEEELQMQADEEEELQQQPVEEEEELQMQPEEEEEETVQGKENSSRTSVVTPKVQTNINAMRGSGKPLPKSARTFFEPRFGVNFNQVRIHNDTIASETAHEIKAKAFTTGKDVVFGTGQYSPETTAGKKLLAHELAHVVQQIGGKQSKEAAYVPGIQREIQLRPPGRGEASAFDRVQELIDRLNTISTGMEYSLAGSVLRYRVIDEAALTNFDRQMRGFIDRAEVVPMRLITGGGYVETGGGGFGPLTGDSFVLGYVDLDDVSFQSMLVHVLRERFSVRNYARRIGTAGLAPAITRVVHRAGHEAQAELFRDILSDPSIHFNYQEEKADHTLVMAFRSRDERYHVFLIIRGAGHGIQRRHGFEYGPETVDE